MQIYLPAKKGKTRLGIIGVGKIANEINEALITLLPDGGKSNTVAFTALNMPWPLPEQSLSDMLSIAEEVLVIEEKRSFVEDQIAKICVKKVVICSFLENEPRWRKFITILWRNIT